MIRINLLPPESGKRAAKAAGAAKQRPQASPARTFYLLMIAAYTAILAAGYYVYNVGAESAQAVKRAETELVSFREKVESERKRLAEATASSREIEEKYEVALALSPTNRVFWSEKVNMLAVARLELAVYITKLELTEKIDEIETPESVKRREEWRAKTDKKGVPEPRPIKRPIINQTIIINAIAYGSDDPQRLRQIVAFQEALKKLTWTRENGQTTRFLDGLNPEFGQLIQKRDTVAGVEVMRFGLVCNADPQVDRSVTEGKAGGATAATPAAATNQGGK